MKALVRAVHPVLIALLRQLAQETVLPVDRHAFISGRQPDRTPVTKGSRIAQKEAHRHGISAQMREQVMRKYGHFCAICGCGFVKSDEIHIDHVLPFSQGGLTVLDNLRATHASCNLKKGSGKRLAPELRSPVKSRPGGGIN